jgi:predicted nucleotidyltransferase
MQPDVRAVYLFGSFASGRATPRSDADIVVEIAPDEPVSRQRVDDAARGLFLEAPVPVDLFVVSSAQMAVARGVAGVVKREGRQLA